MLSILDYRQPVEFKMGDVIARTWTILSRHFLTFVFLVGIAHLLPLVIKVYTNVEAAPQTITTLLATAGIGLLSFILATFAQAIVVHAAFQDLRGRPVSATESIRQGLGRILPVIVASVMMALVVGLGILFFLVPGLIALAAFAVAMPACVVERLGPMESMSRSSNLTSGHRWPIVGIGVAWAVIGLIVIGAIQASMPSGRALPRQLLEGAWQVIGGSFTAVYAAILYHDLRAVSEGIGIDEIASVFD